MHKNKANDIFTQAQVNALFKSNKTFKEQKNEIIIIIIIICVIINLFIIDCIKRNQIN